MNSEQPRLPKAPSTTDNYRRPSSRQHSDVNSPTSVATTGTNQSLGTDPGNDNNVSHLAHISSPTSRNTASSTSTSATHSNSSTIPSNDSNVYSIESSPTATTLPSFALRDGSDSGSRRGASRRRTGPLSAEQREKAALIRRVGACESCRRRRVACHPNHHNMTWEDAFRKYRSGSPTQELAPLSARPSSPKHSGFEAINHAKAPAPQDLPDHMDVDSVSSSLDPVRRLSHGDSRNRTPLPTGPRIERIAAQASQVVQAAQASHSSLFHPTAESIQSELQAMASKISSNPYRSRYNAVQALLLYWEDESDQDVGPAVNELSDVLEKHYQYVSEMKAIPSVSESGKSSWRWLSQTVTSFVDNRDQRDVLKILYYVGQSYLDANREMVLAHTRNRREASTIRWSGIQQILEEANSDTLILMDAAYYPSSKLVRQQGVLEVVAASASEEHSAYLDRTSFTRELTEQLRRRAGQKFLSPFTAAELHAKLLSTYPRMCRDRNPEKQVVTSAPSPLHIQIAANTRLPSVLLAPVRRGLPMCVEPDPSGPQLSLTIGLSDDAIHLESWAEWLRLMPDGIKDLRIEGPYRNP
ncbi:hypothetical protein PspLS_04549 [Pyricularia sp. CBS 133598]|nr:hypothetical protein PspLS_04549 [Pyricularia sp. CBS 133598]